MNPLITFSIGACRLLQTRKHSTLLSLLFDTKYRWNENGTLPRNEPAYGTDVPGADPRGANVDAAVKKPTGH